MWKRWQWGVFCVWQNVWRWACQICCGNFDAFFFFFALKQRLSRGTKCVCVYVCLCACVYFLMLQKFTELLRTGCQFPSQHGVTHKSGPLVFCWVWQGLYITKYFITFTVCVCVCLCIWGCLCTVDGCKYEVSKKGEKKARVWFLYVFAPLRLYLIFFLYVSVHLQYV